VGSRILEYVRRQHLALLALVIAVAGVPVAWAALEKGSVRSRHIKDGGVRQIDIRDRAVGAAKLAPGVVDPARKIDYSFVQPAEHAFEPILELDGLTLEAMCRSFFGYATDITIRATSTAPGASLAWFNVTDQGVAGRGDLDEPITVAIVEASENTAAHSIGGIVYREPGPGGAADSKVISVSMSLSAVNMGELNGSCSAEGTATRATQSAFSP
jgi:hypothetical protein